MTITYQYDPEKEALYGAVEGSVTLEELHLALMEITESEQFPADIRTLWDLRKMDFLNLGWDFGRQLVSIRQLNPKRANSRIALITDNGFGYGMSQMYKIQSADLPQQLMVFCDYGEGENWLLEGA